MNPSGGLDSMVTLRRFDSRSRVFPIGSTRGFTQCRIVPEERRRGPFGHETLVVGNVRFVVVVFLNLLVSRSVHFPTHIKSLCGGILESSMSKKFLSNRSSSHPFSLPLTNPVLILVSINCNRRTGLSQGPILSVLVN